MKFGGTSVEDARAFERVAHVIATRQEMRPVVVISAMSGMTDALLASVQLACDGHSQRAIASLAAQFARHIEVAQELLEPDQACVLVSMIERSLDEIAELLKALGSRSQSRAALQDEVLAYGEQLSSALLAATLCAHGIAAVAVDPRDCIVTDDQFGGAAPLMNETAQRACGKLLPLLDTSLDAVRVPILGGFIGATIDGETTTLGRGGSDYTAAIVGAALRAREIQIWTDVTGVLTADPRVVAGAGTIPRLSYAEAAELAYFGAKVLHPKTIHPAIEESIPVRICNSRAPEEAGTLVGAETENSPLTVKAIAHKTGITTVQVSSARMLGAYGFLRALFEVFDRHRTVVDVVTTSEVSVSLSLEDATELPAIVAELEQLGSVQVEKGRAIICVVGEGLRGTPGIAARVFSTISDINVMLISQGSSSINLTFVVEEERVFEAVRRLHETFFKRMSKVQSPESNIDRETLGASAHGLGIPL